MRIAWRTCAKIPTRVLLDAYSRRHEAQKIYLRQGAAQRWIGWRDHVLQGQPPQAGHAEQLAACDAQLRVVSSVESSRGRSALTARFGALILTLPGTRSHHGRLDPLRYEIFRLSTRALDA
jgi:hypothetical protein